MPDHPTVAVIGSGASGLVAARAMRDAGHRVVVLESRPDLGGVWSASRAYPGLGTQNSKGAYSFSDLPMPADWPEQPTGEQMREYLDRYADLHGLRPLIRFDHRVLEVRRRDAGWSVLVQGPEGREKLSADAVVVASGVFNDPIVPDWAGREAFEHAGGQVLLPQEVDLGALPGRSVAVIGWGKTACDLAVALTPYAASTTVVARSLRWKTPQPSGPLRLHELLMLTRTGEWLLYPRKTRLPRQLYRASRIPVRLLRMLTAELISRQLDLRSLGMRPPGDLVETSNQVTRGLYEAIRDRSITVRHGVGVASLQGVPAPAVVLEGGETVPADVVVLATGYRPRLDYLDADTIAALVDERGQLALDRTVHSDAAPGLYFVGWSGNISGMTTAEVAALWAAAHLAGWSSVPREPAAHRAVPVGGEFSVPMTMLDDIDAQLADLGHRLPRRVRVRQWVRSMDSADYAPALKAVRDRLRAPWAPTNDLLPGESELGMGAIPSVPKSEEEVVGIGVAVINAAPAAVPVPMNEPELFDPAALGASTEG